MQKFVEMMNSPENHFRTLGCEKTLSLSDSPAFKRRIVSFMNIAFEVMEWNGGAANFEGRYRVFEEYAGAKATFRAALEWIFNRSGSLQ